ncbi:phospholipid/cholesterol/gamma-HCH transport system ATP-binding protein [Zhouia amylolytica]|uniref:Phospholipid/cholesterol/gamma-HCH transport system ATP-binding protein n=1 Tax=Zhouia amylolytica TaxID=376730 RepID=A0A1I6RMH5_9FLAO|nr:ATP-binding cassette domain-containing protein [Zhouia amylolytica]SFS65909.1 phospholipid/cholesterol/gamma-HCH transport system ATP-binding protein [Zhouia amylolytica]
MKSLENIQEQHKEEQLETNDAIIIVEDLEKSFASNHVLNGFNMKLFSGENLVIMGKSGSGKSVMIKCLIGLMKPDRGVINIMGKDIVHLDQSSLDELRADIGFLFQGSALYDSMTVRENLEFPLRRHRERFGKNIEVDHMVLEALESVGLAHTVDLMPGELSGGMQRRVALARTLIMKPKIIFYDEPTSGLDPITSKEIIVLMKKIQQQYKTSALIITHDVDCARVISDRMILLVDGVNYAEGTYQELIKVDDPKVKAFFK